MASDQVSCQLEISAEQQHERPDEGFSACEAEQRRDDTDDGVSAFLR